mgnify:CR=1 FL=1
MEVGVTSYFTKRSKKLSAKESALLDQKTTIFQNNPRDVRLKTHQLSGKLREYMAFSLTRRKRVKFILVESNRALFVDVGTHDEVY